MSTEKKEDALGSKLPMLIVWMACWLYGTYSSRLHVMADTRAAAIGLFNGNYSIKVGEAFVLKFAQVVTSSCSSAPHTH